MVRLWKRRTTDRQSWDTSAMAAAIDDVMSGRLGYWAARKQYAVNVNLMLICLLQVPDQNVSMHSVIRVLCSVGKRTVHVQWIVVASLSCSVYHTSWEICCVAYSCIVTMLSEWVSSFLTAHQHNILCPSISLCPEFPFARSTWNGHCHVLLVQTDDVVDVDILSCTSPSS